MPRFQLFEPAIDTPPPPPRSCDHPGCDCVGEFRAPRSRALSDYYWFCLDHVRAYNAAWNYYAGMSEAQIEEEVRKDIVGRRPTWRLGARIAGRYNFRDFGLFDAAADAGERVKPKRRLQTAQEKALAIFDLSLPLTFAAVKARYKELVKRHHPDANGGDKESEERFKIINQAYSTLKASYFS
jgi:DnaJ domain